MRKECILIMALLTALFSLFGFSGCKNSGKFPSDPSSEPVALGFSCSSMSMTDSYSFSLKRADGKILFNANWYSYDLEKQIDFENNEVSEEKMERLLEIIKKHNLVEFVGKYRLKNQKSIFTVLDGTNHYLTLKMSDGSEKQIDTAGAACTDLYAFFTELALETANARELNHLEGDN